MIVVSDASPTSTLLKADQATLLKRLFDFVVIPEAVSEELLAFHAQLPGFVRVQSVSARNHRLSGTENLGKGEAEAIHHCAMDPMAYEVNSRPIPGLTLAVESL